MSNIAIDLKDISKQYRIVGPRQRGRTFREALMQGVGAPFRHMHSLFRGPQDDQDDIDGRERIIWALKDVSFEIKTGEVVGIIGQNGAGKSTLLKILSRITEPTSGYADIYGRVGSLLEVGTGFHSELSGRENIYLNGAILGMRKREIDQKMDQIIAFSEVEKFIDTPVKHYSSGMYLRLAFAVAAHLDPEILLVDEVLAVGDVAFQSKCLGKMEDVAREGRTVLFVSHNLAAIEHLCQKGVVLSDGQVSFTGTSKEAIDYYLHRVSAQGSEQGSHTADLTIAGHRPSRYRPLLKRLELLTEGGKPMNGGMKIGANLTARVHFRLDSPTATFNVGLGFDNLLGQRVFTAHSLFQPDRRQEERVGDQVFVCEIPSFTLCPGEYKIKVSLDVGTAQADVVEEAARVIVVKSDYFGTGKPPWNGLCVLNHTWRLV